MQRKKAISKEQIICTALDLLRDKQDLKDLNLREIARTLGCAHTNLYNYFPSYTELLWSAHAALQNVMMTMLEENLSSAATAERKLKCIFDTVVQIYLDNTGWFRLSWLEYLGDERPEFDVVATSAAREQLNGYVMDIWEELSRSRTDGKKVRETVHIAHCYIIGEVSNYISGRRLIEDKAEFISCVVNQAIRILTMCLREE